MTAVYGNAPLQNKETTFVGNDTSKVSNTKTLKYNFVGKSLWKQIR